MAGGRTHVFVLARMDQPHQPLDDPLFIQPLEGRGPSLTLLLPAGTRPGSGHRGLHAIRAPDSEEQGTGLRCDPLIKEGLG